MTLYFLFFSFSRSNQQDRAFVRQISSARHVFQHDRVSSSSCNAASCRVSQASLLHATWARARPIVFALTNCSGPLVRSFVPQNQRPQDLHRSFATLAGQTHFPDLNNHLSRFGLCCNRSHFFRLTFSSDPEDSCWRLGLDLGSRNLGKLVLPRSWCPPPSRVARLPVQPSLEVCNLFWLNARVCTLHLLTVLRPRLLHLRVGQAVSQKHDLGLLNTLCCRFKESSPFGHLAAEK